MITTSLNIVNLNVLCCNRCKYCLLSWDGKCIGVEDDRAVQYVNNFYAWIKENHPNMNFLYYFGYSMEHPRLFKMIKFLQDIGAVGGEFLQMNGMKMRSNKDLDELFEKLYDVGIKRLDFTLYGTKEYHDEFANRKGDFDLLIRSIEIAKDKGFEIEISIPVIKDNLQQLEELLTILSPYASHIFMFTPHCGGRGIELQNLKITKDDYEIMSETVKKYFNRNKHKTPKEWLDNPGTEAKYRILRLSLLPENIDILESQSFEETIKWLENIEEEYHKVIPSFNELLKMYVDENDFCLYTQKDLHMLYQKRYIKEHDIQIIDVNDERYSGSILY